MNPNRDRYFVRVGDREYEYRTPEARFAAYERFLRAGRREVAAFDLSTRWGVTLEMPVVIYLEEAK